MSKVVTVQVHNLDRLINKINKLAKTPDLTKPMQDCTLKVQKEARVYITQRKRVKTGTLRRSITPQVYREDDNTIGVVFTNIEYAAPVHFGHKVMGGTDRKTVVGMVAPTPFFDVAMENSKKYIDERIALAIEQHNKEAIS